MQPEFEVHADHKEQTDGQQYGYGSFDPCRQFTWHHHTPSGVLPHFDRRRMLAVAYVITF